MDSKKIVDVQDPASDQDAATKKYVDSTVSDVVGDYLPLSAGTDHKLTGGIYMADNYITGLPSEETNSNSDALSYAAGDARYEQKGEGGDYLPLSGGKLTGVLTLDSPDRAINSANGTAGHLKYSGTTKFTWGSTQNVFYQTLSMDNKKIVDLQDPTSNQDAATKKYVDDNGGGGVEIYNGTTPPSSRDRGTLLMTTDNAFYIYTS
jgi:hypothetical protein